MSDFNNLERPSPPVRASRRMWLVYLICGIICTGGLVTVATFPPTNNPWYPKCMLHEVTGLNCPGCGTTRSLHALLNGHLLQAMAYNVFVVLAMVYFIFGGLHSIYATIKKRPMWIPPTWLNWSIVVFMFLYAILRNIPAKPFCYLAPTILE